MTLDTYRFAAITDFIVQPLVDFATNVIGTLGIWGVFVLMTLESACIPVPSEAIMLFAGFNVAEGKMTLFEITAAGVLGNVVGSWIAYGAGYYGRIELIERHGKWLHISKTQMARADRWFEKYGDAAVFFSRMLPIIRTFISLPAGVARMPFWRFTALTTAGCIPWVLMLGVIGMEVGARWEEWRDKLHVIDYFVLAAIVAIIIYLLIKWRRGGREGAKGADETDTSAPLSQVDR